ncbi:substrate-binding domain-containing protein [Methylibium sp.]|uniref:substrate-binding domain-containing protein n=1 Tax=Methylibium sp. TaxID=2067992 RepID=UPI002DB91471|nr:substrate-binding domain-containing protein [Methylibium sp.]
MKRHADAQAREPTDRVAAKAPERDRPPQRVALTYELVPAGTAGAGPVHHPLLALLDAVRAGGSISAAAARLDMSYRHAWGELRRWEQVLGRELIHWGKGRHAALAPFGEKLLWAEKRAQARLAPQIEGLRMELERAFADAFDDRVDVLSMCASHDEALPRLRELALAEQLHLDLTFASSTAALDALDAGRAMLAGFHVIDGAVRGSPSARAWRARLKPGRHKLIGFAERSQGLMLAPGNPLALGSLADLLRPGLRVAGRAAGTGTRVLLDELAQRAGLALPARWALVEPSHAACAQAVASGAADAAFGLEAAARAAGLGFVAIARERYFLVALKSALDEPAMRRLIALLGSAAWAQALAALPGYRATEPGAVLALTKVLPWWSYPRPR